MDHVTATNGGVTVVEHGCTHMGRSIAFLNNQSSGAIRRCEYWEWGPSLPDHPYIISDSGATQAALGFVRRLPGVIGASVKSGYGIGTVAQADPVLMLVRTVRVVLVNVSSVAPDGNVVDDVEMDVVVDAQTGEVVQYDSALGTTQSGARPPIQRVTRHKSVRLVVPLGLTVAGARVETAFPPVLIGGRAYIWCRWMQPLTRDRVSCSLNKGNVTVQVAGQTYRAKTGGMKLAGTKRSIWLGAPLRELHGRLMVPTSCLSALLEASVQYRPRERTLEITPKGCHGVPVPKASAAALKPFLAAAKPR